MLQNIVESKLGSRDLLPNFVESKLGSRDFLQNFANHKIVFTLKIILHSKYTVKPVLSGNSKRRPKLVFKTDNGLMQVKRIAECSKRAFCNTFDLH